MSDSQAVEALSDTEELAYAGKDWVWRFRVTLLRLLAAGTRFLSIMTRTYGLGSEIKDLHRFRYEIYVAEQRKILLEADHVARTLPDQHDASAYHFVVRDLFGRTVGCCRLHIGGDVPDEIIERL